MKGLKHHKCKNAEHNTEAGTYTNTDVVLQHFAENHAEKDAHGYSYA